jgi:hypothetical protein
MRYPHTECHNAITPCSGGMLRIGVPRQAGEREI